MRRVVIFTLLLVFAHGVAAAYEVGDTVDDFTLTDLMGNPVSLSDHQGQVIVLNFFTTWCPGCNEEADLLQHMVWEAYQPWDVQVVAVDIAELTALVTAWAAAREVT